MFDTDVMMVLKKKYRHYNGIKMEIQMLCGIWVEIQV